MAHQRLLLQTVTLTACVSLALGHGRVLEPASRASAWRAGFPTKPDYDDDGANCGGFAHQWAGNGGRCGICGDAYDWPPPRPHELGGIYGQGVIVDHYQPGDTFTATIDLTTSHRGFWEFKLCPDPDDNEQECFDRNLIELEQGGTKFYPTEGSKKYTVKYRLPAGLTCEHCVLQWRYTAGNNWGICKNGTQGLGCGNQEQFGACSDISIGTTRSYDVKYKAPESYEDGTYPMFFYLKHGFFDLEKGKLDQDMEVAKVAQMQLNLVEQMKNAKLAQIQQYEIEPMDNAKLAQVQQNVLQLMENAELGHAEQNVVETMDKAMLTQLQQNIVDQMQNYKLAHVQQYEMEEKENSRFVDSSNLLQDSEILASISMDRILTVDKK